MTVAVADEGNNCRFSGLRRFWAIALVVVTTTIVAAIQPFDNGPVIRSDGYGYHAWTYAFLRGDFNFEGLANETYAFHETRPGYWWNVYPPGVALVRLPVMAPLVGRGERFGRPTAAEHIAAAVLSVLALIGASGLLFYTCRAAGASNLATNIAILAVVFGTGLFHYSTYDASYSHCWTVLGFSAILALAARARHRAGRISPAALVTLAAWLMLVRNTNVFAVTILGAWYMLAGRQLIGVSTRIAFRNTSWLAVGTVIGIGIQLALNTFAHGRLTLSSYEGELFVWDRPMQGSVLCSVAEHGLFPYYPVAALFLALPSTVRRLWSASLAFAILVAIYATLYGYWNMWNLGASFGHRGFVDVLPFGVPLVAVALTRLPKWPRLAIVLTTFACIYMTVSLMAGYWRRTVPYHQISRETYLSHVIGKEQLVVVAFTNLAGQAD